MLAAPRLLKDRDLVIDLAPNITLIYQWILFFIAFGVLHFTVFKPSLRIIEERKRRSSGSRETAEKLARETQEMTALCEKKMEQARLSGIRKKVEKMEIGERFREDLLKKIRSDVDQKLEEVRTKIAAESKKAEESLRTYSKELAKNITSKILEREI